MKTPTIPSASRLATATRRIRRIGRCGPLLLALAAAVAARAGDAAKVLEASGVKGGLVVVLGADDADFLAGLRAAGPYVVQALDNDADRLSKVRTTLDARGVYGPVSAVEWDGGALPYADNVANLLVVSDARCQVSDEEARRVLCPGGAAVRFAPDTRNLTPETFIRKPRPAGIDNWTHYLRDASGNAVARDTVVGPPRRLQWRNHPQILRSHEQNNSIMNVVTAGGRLFYFHDTAPIGVWDDRFPQPWDLVARDAFSGVELWRRPLSKWSWLEWVDTGPEPRGIENLWGSPLTTNRRMVIDEAGTRLYVTLAYRANVVSVLDPATGRTLAELDAKGDADELLLTDDGVLVMRVRAIPARQERYGTKKPAAFEAVIRGEPPEEIVAMRADGGAVLWRVKARHVAPETLAAAGDTVAYYDYDDVVALDRATGAERWRRPAKGFQRGTFVRRYAGMIVLHKDAVLFGAGALTAFDARTGETLWTSNRGYAAMGFFAPGQLAVIDDHVWGGFGSAQQYRTGKERGAVNVGNLISPGHHQRCYRSKATVRYILNAKRGVELIDTAGDNHSRNDWIRSTCGHGLVPANGLLYNPPSPCKCYAGVQVDWFNALAANPGHDAGPARVNETDEGRTVAGPAAERFAAAEAEPALSDVEWPMHRHDPLRSGWAKGAAPAAPKPLWSADLGEPPPARGSDAVSDLTQPVVAAGRVYVAKKSAHRVVCLDAKNGAERWRFTAGAPIDSSPTVVALGPAGAAPSAETSLCCFGCDDGRVYALSADDGRVAWTFRAAPEDRRIVDGGAVRSVWPSHGSVVLQKGVLYCSAGRSTYLDGGIFIYGLDPRTGAIVHRLRLDGPWPDAIKEPGHPSEVGGTISDLLVSDGENLHMLAMGFTAKLQDIEPESTEVRLGAPQSDLKVLQRPFIREGQLDRRMPIHLTASSGLLNESGFNRIHWYYSDTWQRTDSREGPKEGNMLVFDDRNTYGVKFYHGPGFSPKFTPANNDVILFADPNGREPVYVPTHEFPKGVQHYRLGREGKPLWEIRVPVLVNAMAITGGGADGARRLVIAGPPDIVPEKDPLAAFEGRAGGRLTVVSAETGEVGATVELDAPPVWDGLSASGGELFVSLANGRVVCLGE